MTRGLVAAFIGAIAGIAYYYGQALQSGSPPNYGPVFGATALLTTMLALVAIELAGRPSALPTVPAGLVSMPRPIRALRGRASRGRRYVQILAIAARNGLNPYLRDGRRSTSRRRAWPLPAAGPWRSAAASS